MRLFSVMFLIAVTSSALHAEERDDESVKPFGEHHGYLFDVQEERNRRELEMVMLEKPRQPDKSLNEVIFNEKLSREFQQQYEYRFGQTQAEQTLNTSSRSDEYSYFTGQNVTILEYQDKQRSYGEYMARRLTEFHVDDWAKNDPDFKIVHQAKERFSNLNMEVQKGYKIKWKYNLSGPNMEASVENPYDVDVKVRVEMSGVLSSPNETIYTVGYPVTERIRISALHREQDGLYQLVGTRRLTKRLSASVTGSTDRRKSGPSVHQDLILIGFSWNE